jgi:hypothetical protein
MKTTILTAAFILLVTLANARTTPDTTANPLTVKEQFKAYVIQPSEDLIKFRVTNPSLDKVVMKIYNGKNEKVFHRSTKKDKVYSIGCDMRNCESGIYTCVVERNGKVEVTKQIIIQN